MAVHVQIRYIGIKFNCKIVAYSKKGIVDFVLINADNNNCHLTLVVCLSRMFPQYNWKLSVSLIMKLIYLMRDTYKLLQY